MSAYEQLFADATKYLRATYTNDDSHRLVARLADALQITEESLLGAVALSQEKSILGMAWSRITSLHPAPENSSWRAGYAKAITDALSVIEYLGGFDPHDREGFAQPQIPLPATAPNQDEFTLMNLRALVHRLISQIKRFEEDNKVVKQASDWMDRKGFGLNPLRKPADHG